MLQTVVLILPLLSGVQGNSTAAAQDSVLYQQFLSGEHGMVTGIPNLALGGMVLAPLILLLVVAVLVKRHKEKNQVKKVDDLPAPTEDDKPRKNGDIFEEIEDEIAKHNTHKKKLGLYLKFLATRDGGNLARTNAKRNKKGSDDEDGDDMDEDERAERAEQQRQQLQQQLKMMLQAQGGGNPAMMARLAAMQRERQAPPILD